MVTNCPKCGRVFRSIGSFLCESCVKQEKSVFEKVRTHLKENPGLTLMQLAEETEVSSKKIQRYIREGRLELMEAELSCEKCSIPVKSGRYCPACVELIAKTTMVVLSEREEKVEGPRMHTYESRKNK